MFKSIHLFGLVSARSNRRLFLSALVLLFLFIFTNTALDPMPMYGQTIPQPNSKQLDIHLPFAQKGPVTNSTTSPTPSVSVIPIYATPTPVPPSFPDVYHSERAAYVTDAVDLAPFEMKRWGRGKINGSAYSPTGDRIALATDAGVWIYRLDEPDNGRLFAQRSYVRNVSWSPDGSQLAISSDNNIVRTWNVASGEEVSVLEGHTNDIRSVSWSPDGAQIASGSDDGTLRIWDVGSSEEVRRLNLEHPVRIVSWSPDGSQVAASLNTPYLERSFTYLDPLFVWDVASGNEVNRFRGIPASSLSWSPDGSQLLSSENAAFIMNDGSVIEITESRIRDVATKKLVSYFDGSTSGVRSANWSPDGSQVISISDDGAVQFWDVASGEETRRFGGHAGSVNSVSWSPDGSQAISISDEDTVRLLDVVNGVEIGRLNHMAGVRSMSWSPDGSQVASASHDDRIRILDVASGAEIRSLERMKGVDAVRWSSAGNQLLFSTENEFCTLDLISAEGVSCQGHGLQLRSASWSPDGSHIASSSYNRPHKSNSVRIWNVETGNQKGTLIGHTNDVNTVAWSPNGNQIVSGSDDKTIRIWNVDSGEEVHRLEGHAGTVDSVSWSPDGSQVASGSDDNTVRVWAVNSGEEVRRFKGHTGDILSVSWSPDGRYLASGSSDSTVRIWDVARRVEVSVFEGHAGSVNRVSWSPDGSQVISISDDDTMRIWNFPIPAWDDDGSGTPTVPEPSIELLKVGTVNDLDGDGVAEVGETISYSFTVRNTGNVDLFGIIVTDTLVALNGGSIGRLVPGDVDTATFSAVYRLTEADILNGSVTSSAVANAIYGLGDQINDTSDDPNNLDDNDTDGNGDPDDPTVVSIAMTPRLTLKKIGYFVDENGDGRAQAGETISYAFIVENTGNVDLTNVVITDTLLPMMGDPITLLPTATEESGTFRALYTITADDIAASDNIAVDGVVSEATATGISSTGGTAKVVLDSLTQPPLLPALYHPDRAGYVTELVELAPFEVERWGRGRIADSVYSPAGNQLAVVTSIGVWIYRLDNPDNGRLFAHTHLVNSVSWSPDETQVASGADDGVVRIWDVASGEVVSSLSGQAEKVSSVSWSPDGSQVASGSHDSTVWVWDVMSERVVSFLNHTSHVNSVSWSPDGSRLVSGSGYYDDDKHIQIWDVVSGEQVSYLGGYMSPIGSVSWSPDGSQVASGSQDQTVRIWDVASGAEVNRFVGHTGSVKSVRWSPDGTRVASGADDFREEYSAVRIWDVVSGEEVSRFEGYTSESNGVSWSPDGSHLAFGSGDTVRIFDVASGAKVSRLFGHTDQVYSVGWSPDGSQVMSKSSDFSEYGSSLWNWDAASGKSVSFPEDYTRWLQARDVSWASDGSLVAYGLGGWPGPGWVDIRDGASGELMHEFGGDMPSVTSVSLSPDSSQVVAGFDSRVGIWDIASDGAMDLLYWHWGEYDEDFAAVSISWSPDGGQIFVGTASGAVRIWDVASSEEVRRFEGHTDSVQILSWSPDGRQLASGSTDGTVRIWNVASGEEVLRFEGHTDGVASVGWSPDGSQIVSGSADGTVRIWNVE